MYYNGIWGLREVFSIDFCCGAALLPSYISFNIVYNLALVTAIWVYVVCYTWVP